MHFLCKLVRMFGCVSWFCVTPIVSLDSTSYVRDLRCTMWCVFDACCEVCGGSSSRSMWWMFVHRGKWRVSKAEHACASSRAIKIIYFPWHGMLFILRIFIIDSICELDKIVVFIFENVDFASFLFICIPQFVLPHYVKLFYVSSIQIPCISFHFISLILSFLDVSVKLQHLPHISK